MMYLYFPDTPRTSVLCSKVMTSDTFNTCVFLTARSTLYTCVTAIQRHNTQPIPSEWELQALAIVYSTPKGGSTVLMFTFSASPKLCITQFSHLTFHCSNGNINVLL